MARRDDGPGRTTPAGSIPADDLRRSSRPVWVRLVVVLMLLALLLSVVAAFITALQ